ncbi:hypothetical protein [Rhodopirellula europaea]|uniref:hypothetical protein n=1 Tax=Rhodopirellula europaea TaxID=1263866 RepID=UPI003D29397E
MMRSLLCTLLLISSAVSLHADSPESKKRAWETLETNGHPTARHEAALVGFQNKLYLLGGRRINPVDVYDPATNVWTANSKTPLELHHFQGVIVEDAIYLMGAMTGALSERDSS